MRAHRVDRPGVSRAGCDGQEAGPRLGPVSPANSHLTVSPCLFISDCLVFFSLVGMIFLCGPEMNLIRILFSRLHPLYVDLYFAKQMFYMCTAKRPLPS